jgi:hypothetical protein
VVADAGDVATIAFGGEAHESAAAAINRMLGWCVQIELLDGTGFDAEVCGVSGTALLAKRWDDDAGRGVGEVESFDLYEDVARIVVY